ncbi:histidine phosphatase family protein [uncultured Roseobacter sp.]|uniref:histidine phosphatase family protein n=1 Tax=uncultured Roseobacter sp. TaxID=114847 RepID=UPI00260FABB9|nr:histidine phosphatase family protein [uncultured Roseobacter sp.]
MRYLSHPQVLIEPHKDIDKWSLNELGLQRVHQLAERDVLTGTTRVVSSAETKAVETARPLAAALGLTVEVRPRMHENDRSATGFLPSDTFEAVADRFFNNPAQSILGWETANHAQQRIVDEVNAVLEGPITGDLLLVGHGAAGTLLYCALSGREIDRKHDQPNGGGCFFSFSTLDRRPRATWQPMELMS